MRTSKENLAYRIAVYVALVVLTSTLGAVLVEVSLQAPVAFA